MYDVRREVLPMRHRLPNSALDRSLTAPRVDARWLAMVVGLTFGLAAPVTLAQSTPPTIPAKKPSPSLPTAPARPAQIVPAAGDQIGAPAGGRFGEGKFVLRRRGVLVPAPTGEWVFAFLPRADGVKDRPVVLLPNSTLDRLEQSLGIKDDGSGMPDRSAVASKVVTLTGQIFFYAGREYLLAGAFSIGAVEEAPAPEPVKPAASSESAPAASDQPAPTPDAVASAAGDSGVEALIQDLEARRGPTGRRAITSAPAPEPAAKPSTAPAAEGTPAPAPEAGAPSTGGPTREGVVLTAARGRLVRLGGGELAFAADNDQNSRTRGPMVLLPCKSLTRLEELAMARGDALAIELSGRVTSYKGRSFVLPTSFLIPSPSELRPAQ
jgi:hypothetical protein